jgi:hypothetical protein
MNWDKDALRQIGVFGRHRAAPETYVWVVGDSSTCFAKISRSDWRQLPGDRGLLRLAAFAFLDGLAEEVFDLPVDAAQIALRPGFEFGPERRIDA